MAATPDQPQSSTPSHPGPRKITWSEASKSQKIAIICMIMAAVIIPGAGLIFLFEVVLPEPAPPLTAEEKQERDEERVIERNEDRLEQDAGKTLRPGKEIEVSAGHRHDGWYFVLAEYKPLMTDPKMIEDDMMEAYKVIYTSGLPVINAEITAVGDLVDSYGNESKRPIYRSSMDGERAGLINWDNLSSVNPRAAFSGSWQHLAIR